MATNQRLIDELSALTVLEAAEISKLLEEKWGRSAVASADASADPIEGQASFTVVLASAGEKRINVIKEIRALTGLGLKEAKALVESAPQVVKAGLSKHEAAQLMNLLEDQGAAIELKISPYSASAPMLDQLISEVIAGSSFDELSDEEWEAAKILAGKEIASQWIRSPSEHIMDIKILLGIRQ